MSCPERASEPNEGNLVQSIGRWGVGLICGSIALLVLLATAVSLIYRSPTESCIAMAAPPDAVISEASFPTGRLSWFPLGLFCEFPRDGGGVISTTPGAGLSIALVLLLLVLAAGIVMILRAFVRRTGA